MERLCLESRRHCVVLARPLFWAFVLALAGGMGTTFGWPFEVAGAAGLTFGALIALRAVWRWDRTKLVVTTERLSVVQGTLRRKAATVRLDAVEGIQLEQTLLGRLLRYGTVSAGSIEVSHVPAPRDVCRLVENLSN